MPRLLQRGQVIFRAVRPHICRLTISLEFVGPGDEASEWALGEEVARLETTVDRFALEITKQLEEAAILQHAIFA